MSAAESSPTPNLDAAMAGKAPAPAPRKLIAGTVTQLEATFAEWERRYREEPERFIREQERLKWECETYGEISAAYFLAILTELQEKGVQ